MKVTVWKVRRPWLARPHMAFIRLCRAAGIPLSKDTIARQAIFLLGVKLEDHKL